MGGWVRRPAARLSMSVWWVPCMCLSSDNAATTTKKERNEKAMQCATSKREGYHPTATRPHAFHVHLWPSWKEGRQRQQRTSAALFVPLPFHHPRHLGRTPIHASTHPATPYRTVGRQAAPARRRRKCAGLHTPPFHPRPAGGVCSSSSSSSSCASTPLPSRAAATRHHHHHHHHHQQQQQQQQQRLEDAAWSVCSRPKKTGRSPSWKQPPTPSWRPRPKWTPREYDAPATVGWSLRPQPPPPSSQGKTRRGVMTLLHLPLPPPPPPPRPWMVGCSAMPTRPSKPASKSCLNSGPAATG